jgi:hypothetical protein
MSTQTTTAMKTVTLMLRQMRMRSAMPIQKQKA